MNFNNDRNFEVIVSHPARQGFVYEVPLAAQRHGIPVKLLTGLYYKPGKFPYSLVKFLPPSKQAEVVRQLEKRRLQELNPESVISIGGPWLESIFRPWSLYRIWAKTHDWLASSWVQHLQPPTKPTILHCFDGSSKRTLAKAKGRGFITVYESTIPPMLVNMLIEERRRLGLRISQGWYAQSRRWEEHLTEECLLADYCLAQSWVTVDALMKIGIPASKIILLSLGVDTERFHPPVVRRSASPFRVIFVGQIALRKGLQYLLEAWKQLNIPDAELVLAGYVNKSDGGMELLARYQGYYKWIGFVSEELSQIYQSADIFILPSLSEGASMATMEALSSGLPCIITKNVGCVLRDGLEGFVVPFGDIESLKHRIRQLYDDPDLRQRMGGVARARVERLTWQEYGRRLILIYKLILNGERESASDVLNMMEL